MNIFVTGGTGQTGPAIVSELLASGHAVTGLARSDASAARLKAMGATPWPGSVDDLDSLRSGASAADGVIHMAIAGDFSDPEDITRREVAAIQALGEPLVGTGKPLITTSGTLVLPPGRVSTEDDVPDPASIGSLRIPGEEACLAFARHGVRSAVIRLAPTVHGPRDRGFMPMLIENARRTGISAYVGDGTNRWPAVNRLDAATLYRLAVESAPAGQVLHAVGEQSVSFASIAEKISDKLGVPVMPVPPGDAAAHFANPFMAVVFATDAPASSERTQGLLGWKPEHMTLLEDLDRGDYFADVPLPGPAGRAARDS